MKKVKTYTAQIYMAGDIQQAKQVCRAYCAIGFCVTIEPLDFIYTGGEESGFRIGLINYPRFPSTKDEVQRHAVTLAKLLQRMLHQDSYSIVYPDNTVWESKRK